MFTKRKVKKFVDGFADVLFEEIEDVKHRLDEAEANGNKDEVFRESCELMQREFVFQIFGRHVEAKLGIKFFDEEKKGQNNDKH